MKDMFSNKKGIRGGSTIATWLIVIVGVALALLIVPAAYQQTFGGTGSQAAISPSTPAASGLPNAGDSGTLKSRAVRLQSEGAAQVAATLYVKNGQKLDSDTSLLEDATAMSATARTNTPVVVGDVISAVAFDTTYGGIGKENILLDREVYYLDLEVYTLQTGLGGGGFAGGGNKDVKLTFPADTDNAVSDDEAGNVTLAADQVRSIGPVMIEVNTSNEGFNFKGIVMNTAATNNLDSVTIGGMTSGSCPKRRQSTCTWAYYIPDAILLEEFDTWQSGNIVVDASGTNPAQLVTLGIVDEAYYKSIEPGKPIRKGIEDDASSPAQVGAQDLNVTIAVE